MKTAATFLLFLALLGTAASEDFRARGVIKRANGGKGSNANIVVWLTPIAGPVRPTPLSNVQLLQKNKHFMPHLLVIPTGSKVQFPNQDPFFHNVFSLYKGKRFDLGLYEAGGSKTVTFDRPGVSFIFCNIHPDMSAAVVVVDTPYYGTSSDAGDVTIHNVPAGAYKLSVWYERSSAEALAMLTRDIVLSAQQDVLQLEVPEVVAEGAAHKNKYGSDYEKSKPYEIQ